MKKYISPATYICQSTLKASVMTTSDKIYTKPESNNGGYYLGDVWIPGGPGNEGDEDEMNGAKYRGLYSGFED